MTNEVVKASSIARKAMRKANNKSKSHKLIKKQKKIMMRQNRRLKYSNAKETKAQLGNNYSKHIEWAILMTIFIGILSVKNTKLGILAIIFSILTVGAMIDSHLKLQRKDKVTAFLKNDMNNHIQKIIRVVKNDKNKSLLKLEKSPLEFIPPPSSTVSFREFPYK